MITVTKDGWNVSYVTGFGIESGFCRLSVFRNNGPKHDYGHGNGLIMTYLEARAWCLAMGYIQAWKPKSDKYSFLCLL